MSTEDLSLDDYISRRRISSHRSVKSLGDRSRNYGYNKRSHSPAFWEHDLYDEDGRGRPSRSSSRVRRPGMRSRSRSPLYRHRYSQHEREERILDRSGCKIIIDNLDFGVTDDDMKDLFEEFGNIKRVSVLFNSHGKSTGSAEIVFRRAEFANDAQAQYDGVLLDGRPMYITVVKDHSRDHFQSRGRSRSPRYNQYRQRSSSRPNFRR
ncbi:unnamed protein product [Oikopleura dioica]|uniref:RRM domain-containing protein n=1 Tax=Oikopleura dioica TaxID=34765 RepID=E4WRQ3_OIKDI|nr:unnamed protein product [Oikopleura dioica]